jgi:hypothetical protein
MSVEFGDDGKIVPSAEELEYKATAKVFNQRLKAWKATSKENLIYYSRLCSVPYIDDNPELTMIHLAHYRDIIVDADGDFTASHDGHDSHYATPAAKKNKTVLAAEEEKQAFQGPQIAPGPPAKGDRRCCGSTWPNESLYCETCGSALEIKTTCKCGNQKGKGDFCGRCGFNFTSTGSQSKSVQGELCDLVKGALAAGNGLGVAGDISASSTGPVASTGPASTSGVGATTASLGNDKATLIRTWKLANLRDFLLAAGTVKERFETKLKHDQKHPPTRFESVEAFAATWSVLVEVAAKSCTTQLVELIAHQKRITKMAKAHGNWTRVAEYDLLVRMTKEESPNDYSLLNMDQDSWNLAESTGSLDQGSNRKRKQNSGCRQFNKDGTCSYGDECGYLHQCFKCKSTSHHIKICPFMTAKTPRVDGSSSSRPTPTKT